MKLLNTNKFSPLCIAYEYLAEQGVNETSGIRALFCVLNYALPLRILASTTGYYVVPV
jgi:hypothetical protein